MVTYNQDKYIALSIESVLMQKTNFPFRLVIGEDCSTDNTRLICLEYATKFPDKIKLLSHNTNLGLVKNYQSVFKECTAKYLAILEGDDYWTDPHKLQKQYDILEKNDNIGLVYAHYSTLTDGKLRNFVFPPHAKLQGRIYDELITGNYIGPLTVCLRKSLVDAHLDFENMINENYLTIDYVIWLELAQHSDFVYLNEPVAVYRKEKGSVSIPKEFEKFEKFTETIFKILKYFAHKYPTRQELLSVTYNALYYDLMLKSIHYSAYDKVNYYNALCKPQGLIQHIRYYAAKYPVTIQMGKFLKFFN